MTSGDRGQAPQLRVRGACPSPLRSKIGRPGKRAMRCRKPPCASRTTVRPVDAAIKRKRLRGRASAPATFLRKPDNCARPQLRAQYASCYALECQTPSLQEPSNTLANVASKPDSRSCRGHSSGRSGSETWPTFVKTATSSPAAAATPPSAPSSPRRRARRALLSHH